MAPRTIYTFGNGQLSFADFLGLYVPAIEAALGQFDTAWVVGDFRGVDTLALEYLKDRTSRVTVFHAGASPRYLPDRRRAGDEAWRLCGGFADDRARDDAAIAACTHFLAVDRFSTPTRPSGTGSLIARCLARGKAPVVPDVDRAVRVGRVLAQIDRAQCHPTARAFARILVELFPPWFGFEPEHLAVLTWGMGLHLLVSGPTRDRGAQVAMLTTSDSRNMRCAVHTSSLVRGEVAEISMHYAPSEEHRARARDAIALALRPLFPDAPIDPALLQRVPEGRVFPDELS